MCRDEADVAEGMLRHLDAEVDHIVVADNGSKDGTREILDQLSKEISLTVLDDPDLAYYQSKKISALAELAATEHGADWLLPVDFDEIWYSVVGRIRDTLAGLPDSVRALKVPLYNHFCSSIDPAGSDPFRTIGWRQREPGALPKVAFRWEPGTVVHQGNHGVSMPTEGGRSSLPLLELRHFPFRSADQMVRKALNGAEAYKASDLPETMGHHWRSYGQIIEQHGEEALRSVFRQHFWYLSPVDGGLIHDPAPYRRWEVNLDEAPEGPPPATEPGEMVSRT